jgi:hypothetical protein
MQEEEREKLYAQIGQQKAEIDWLKKNFSKAALRTPVDD